MTSAMATGKFQTPALASLMVPDYSHPINPHLSQPHLRRTRRFPTYLHSPRPRRPQSFVPLFNLANDLHKNDVRRGDSLKGVVHPEEIRRPSGEVLWKYEPREACDLSEEEALEVRTRLAIERGRDRFEFLNFTIPEYHARHASLTSVKSVKKDVKKDTTETEAEPLLEDKSKKGEDENERIGKIRGTRRFWRRKEGEAVQSSAGSVRSLASLKDGIKARLLRVRGSNYVDIDQQQEQPKPVDPIMAMPPLTRTTANVPAPPRRTLTSKVSTMTLSTSTRNLNPFNKTKKVWSSGSRFTISEEDFAPLIKNTENIKITETEIADENVFAGERRGWFGRRQVKNDIGSRLRR